MIIREHDQTFIMIEQNHHAHLSAEIILNWQEIFFQDDPYVDSVLYAIKHHDYGWELFDKQPFLNDETGAPYSFIDFPLLPKTVLYTQGVDKVERDDPYAAALCSAHYIRFMENNPSPVAQDYIEQEEKRKERILTNFPVSKTQFDHHLAILQFADNISLYLCLNELGAPPKNIHYFFKKGIPISPKIKQINTNKIQADWLDDKTVSLKGLPNIPAFSVSIEQKQLSKQAIKQTGLIKQYQGAAYDSIKINFIIS